MRPRSCLPCASVCLAVVLAAAAGGAEPPPPEFGKERIVLRTIAGDLVLALYPKVAPGHCEQVLKLARAGVYDGVHFYRIHPGFVAQITTHLDRTEGLTAEQKALVKPLKAEFSGAKHTYGRLTMARNDNQPDSAETSFSIMLGAAPHLDGQYTVFGELVKGQDVLKEFERVPRNAQYAPKIRLTVLRVDIAESEADLEGMNITPRLRIPFEEEEEKRKQAEMSTYVPAFAGIVIAVMLLVSVLQWALAEKIPPRALASIQLISVLVGAVFVVALVLPLAQQRGYVALLVFFGIVGLFKLMNRFEAPAPPPKKPAEPPKA